MQSSETVVLPDKWSDSTYYLRLFQIGLLLLTICSKQRESQVIPSPPRARLFMGDTPSPLQGVFLWKACQLFIVITDSFRGEQYKTLDITGVPVSVIVKSMMMKIRRMDFFSEHFPFSVHVFFFFFEYYPRHRFVPVVSSSYCQIPFANFPPSVKSTAVWKYVALRLRVNVTPFKVRRSTAMWKTYAPWHVRGDPDKQICQSSPTRYARLGCWHKNISFLFPIPIFASRPLGSIHWLARRSSALRFVGMSERWRVWDPITMS